MGQHHSTDFHALAEVGLCSLRESMTCVKHIIHQDDNRPLRQLIIEGEVYLRQVVVAVLLLQLVKRGMGRTDQAAVAVYFHIVTKVVGDIIRIAGYARLSWHGNKHHPFTLCLWNLLKEIG